MKQITAVTSSGIGTVTVSDRQIERAVNVLKAYASKIEFRKEKKDAA